MKGHNFEFEEFHISEAVGHSFHGFDFVVYALISLFNLRSFSSQKYASTGSTGFKIPVKAVIPYFQHLPYADFPLVDKAKLDVHNKQAFFLFCHAYEKIK